MDSDADAVKALQSSLNNSGNLAGGHAGIRAHTAPYFFPVVQEAEGPDVTYHLAVMMDPEQESELTFEFGDGAKELVPIPAGSGLHRITLTHRFPSDLSILKTDSSGFVVQTATVEGMHPATGFTRFGGKQQSGQDAHLDELRQELAAIGITLQPGLEEYMRNRGDACHIQIRETEHLEAAARALSLFRTDLFSIPHPDEPSEPLPNFASGVTHNPEGPYLWFDVKDNFEVAPELVKEALKLLANRLVETGAIPATIGRLETP